VLALPHWGCCCHCFWCSKAIYIAPDWKVNAGSGIPRLTGLGNGQLALLWLVELKLLDCRGAEAIEAGVVVVGVEVVRGLNQDLLQLHGGTC
jgi:hypothetical protein